MASRVPSICCIGFIGKHVSTAMRGDDVASWKLNDEGALLMNLTNRLAEQPVAHLALPSGRKSASGVPVLTFIMFGHLRSSSSLQDCGPGFRTAPSS